MELEQELLREWSRKLNEKSFDELSKYIFGEEYPKFIEKQIMAFEPPANDQEAINQLQKSTEMGNKDAFYRNYFYNMMPIQLHYFQENNMVPPGEQLDWTIGGEGKGLLRKNFYGLMNSKVFSPTDDLFEMLLMTDTGDEMMTKAPYPATFVSKVWNFGSITCWGCLMLQAVKEEKYDKSKWSKSDVSPIVVEKSYENYSEFPENFYIAIVTGYDHKEEDFFQRELFVPAEDGSESEVNLVNESVYEKNWSHGVSNVKKMVSTVKGLFHFINSPNVEYVEKKERDISDKGNKRRMKKGKAPSPSHSVVDLDGETKRYLQQVREREGEDLRSLHWVRGHFRVLRDEDYWGDRAGDRIWVRPHMKGDGDLIEQEYEVKSNA